jgi:hypothetical protein
MLDLRLHRQQTTRADPMSDREALRRLLQQSPALAAKVVGFNWELAVSVHPTHRRQCLPEIPDAVWHEPRLKGRLSNLLLNRVGLSDRNFFETPNALWPLALLPADRLHRLSLHIGALILGIRVRSSLSREHVIGWKKKLGEEAYRFAMNSASLLPAGRLPLKAIATEAADELGASVVMAALTNEPEGLRRRVALKFPTEVAALDMEPASATQVCLMIARMLEGEWFSSLAALRK